MTTWDCFLYHNLSKTQSRDVSLGHDVDFLMFERQIIKMKKNYDVVSPEVAIQCLHENRKGKFASVWFDDGFKSVLDIGFPILQKHNVTATVSVCSSFYNHESVFWRKKLITILQLGEGRNFVRYLNDNSTLCGWKVSSLMLDSLDNFSDELIVLLNEFIKNNSLTVVMDSIKKEFCTKNELKFLKENGWGLCNHSSNHYPITEKSAFNNLEKEFSSNQKAIEEDFKVDSFLNVAPFCRAGKMDDRVKNYAQELSKKQNYLVLVSEKTNTPSSIKSGMIYRHTARTG